MPTYPKDRFDDLPPNMVRIGSHRGPKPRGRAWIALAWGSLATVILVIGGMYALSRLDAAFEFELPIFVANTPTPTPTPTPVIIPITDPTTIEEREIAITVLNGTDLVGLANAASDALKEQNWVVGSTANASTSDIEETVVYYREPTDEDAALGVAMVLGLEKTQLSDAFPGAKITIVLGSDYTPPE